MDSDRAVADNIQSDTVVHLHIPEGDQLDIVAEPYTFLVALASAFVAGNTCLVAVPDHSAPFPDIVAFPDGIPVADEQPDTERILEERMLPLPSYMQEAEVHSYMDQTAVEADRKHSFD